MKRTLRALALLFCLSSVCLLFSCGEGTRFTVALTAPPASNVYTLGEEFRTEGLKLLITYDDGRTEEKDVTPAMVTFSSAHAGAAVAVIAYTYDGYTAYTYVNTVIRDTLSDARHAALLTIDTSALYLEHKNDPAVKSLYATAAAAIASATTTDGVNAARDTFLSAVATVTSDKTAARNRVAAVSLADLSGEYLAIAENERARALLAIELARTTEEADELAALYETQIENLLSAQETDISAEEKRGLYVALEEYFRRTVEDNRILYDEEDFSSLRAAYTAATLGLLSADTKAEADAFVSTLYDAVNEAKTLVDKVYDRLLLVYTEGEVLYNDASRDAILALRTALTLAETALPPDRAAVLASYAVSADRRIAALTYTDGRIDLTAATAAAEALYATLTAAKDEADAITAAIGEIGTVTLGSETNLLAAENAFAAWTETYTVSEKNAALLLGTAHADLAAKREAFDTLRDAAVSAADAVKEKATVLASAVYTDGMGDESVIADAEEAYSAWVDAYGSANADSYLGDSFATISAARDAYTAKLAEFTEAKTDAGQELERIGTEIKGEKPDKLSAISAILTEKHSAIDEVTFDEWKANSAVFSAILLLAESEMNAL